MNNRLLSGTSQMTPFRFPILADVEGKGEEAEVFTRPGGASDRTIWFKEHNKEFSEIERIYGKNRHLG
jgi:hypothetical protein